MHEIQARREAVFLTFTRHAQENYGQGVIVVGLTHQDPLVELLKNPNQAMPAGDSAQLSGMSRRSFLGLSASAGTAAVIGVPAVAKSNSVKVNVNPQVSSIENVSIDKTKIIGMYADKMSVLQVSVDTAIKIYDIK